MSTPFPDRLEVQLLDAAERDCARPLARRAARRVGVAGPAALAVAAAAAIGITVLSTGGEEPASGPDRTPAPASAAPPAATSSLPLSRVRVYVLNAAVRNGIAGEAAQELERLGAQIQGTGNATVNTLKVSEVHAAPQDRAAAREVARRLGIRAEVQPLTRELAVQAPGAKVVVVLGRDRT